MLNGRSGSCVCSRFASSREGNTSICPSAASVRTAGEGPRKLISSAVELGNSGPNEVQPADAARAISARGCRNLCAGCDILNSPCTPRRHHSTVAHRNKHWDGIGTEGICRTAPVRLMHFPLFLTAGPGPQFPLNMNAGACDGGWSIAYPIWPTCQSHSTCIGTREEGDDVPPINWIRNLVSHLLSGYEGFRIREPAVEVGCGPAYAGVLEGGRVIEPRHGARGTIKHSAMGGPNPRM